MNLWDVHLTVRGRDGRRKKESFGSYAQHELPAVLEALMRLARELRGGIQITRARTSLVSR